MKIRAVAAAAALTGAIVAVAPASLQAQTEEARVVGVIDAYHAALAAGDSATALSLLADDVTILETGGVENKEHYRGGHLPADMRFAHAVPRERGDVTVRIVGSVAWAWSTSVTQGRMGDRDIDSQGAELMVLVRSGSEWRIEAIHWSSRQRR